jgi:hypothetical protein
VAKLLNMLTLQSIKIYDHPILDSLEVKFKLNDNLKIDGTLYHKSNFYTAVKLIGGEYDSPVNEIGDLFWMLTLLLSDVFSEFMKQFFHSQPTKIRVSYLEDEVSYFYALNISNKGIHSQVFIKDGNPVFQSQEDTFKVLMCADLERFLNHIIYIDLNRDDEIDYMLSSGQELCETNSFREFIGTILISLGVTSDPLIYKNEKVEVLDIGTNRYIPIEEANKTIKTLFGICTTITPCFQGSYLVIINNFKGIDIIKKSQIVSYFLSPGVNRESAQLLLLDPDEFDGYGLVLEKSQKGKLVLDNLGNYQITIDE